MEDRRWRIEDGGSRMQIEEMGGVNLQSFSNFNPLDP
jgi:hypothetical protein